MSERSLTLGTVCTAICLASFSAFGAEEVGRTPPCAMEAEEGIPRPASPREPASAADRGRNEPMPTAGGGVRGTATCESSGLVMRVSFVEDNRRNVFASCVLTNDGRWPCFVSATLDVTGEFSGLSKWARFEPADRTRYFDNIYRLMPPRSEKMKRRRRATYDRSTSVRLQIASAKTRKDFAHGTLTVWMEGKVVLLDPSARDYSPKKLFLEVELDLGKEGLGKTFRAAAPFHGGRKGDSHQN